MSEIDNCVAVNRVVRENSSQNEKNSKVSHRNRKTDNA